MPANIRVLRTTCRYLLGQQKCLVQPLGGPVPSHTYLKCSQHQWYIKVSLPHRCWRLIYGPITGLEQQRRFPFVLFLIFNPGFFTFVDYGKYNICFQNVGLAGIRKEGAWQADYLGLLHYGDADSYAMGLDLVILSCIKLPWLPLEINRALVCRAFSASWSSNQHIPEGPMRGRAKKTLWGKKIFQCFFKFVPEVSFLCKWLAQDQTNNGVGRKQNKHDSTRNDTLPICGAKQ